MLLNKDIADIERPSGICLLTFDEGNFSWLILRPSIFAIIH